MSLPKTVKKLIDRSCPYGATKTDEIKSIILIDTIISGDVYIYHNNCGEFTLDRYVNQGGMPAKYVKERNKKDSIKTYNWEDIMYQMEMRKKEGWDIRACD
jgi:hypothetical protein